MLARLAAVDPDRAEKLAPTDRRRIIRALEIYRLTGQTQTAHDDESRTRPPAFQALYAVLRFEDRGKLYERIEQRVDRMCREGLFEETARLLESGVSPDSTCMQAIGYRQAAWALRGEMPRDEAIVLIAGTDPLRDRKYDIESHPRWKEVHPGHDGAVCEPFEPGKSEGK
jgi:tRNA A37 N6-isopentenylltransferase MiaA